VSLHIPENCGYNKRFAHSYSINSHSLPGSCVDQIQSIVTGKWGWHFEPHPDMDYGRENWYERQDCYVSFEHLHDMIQVVLQVDFN